MRIRHSASNESGQALVEFALVLPILLLVVFAIFEFGRVMSAYQTIVDTGREAVRQAVVADGKPCSEKQQSIANMVDQRLSGAGLDPNALSYEPQTLCEPKSGQIAVAFEYPYGMVLLKPFLGLDAISLRTMTVMRQE